MFKDLFKTFKKKEVIPAPMTYPSFDTNIVEWMEEVVLYWEKTKPEKMYMLFCPSFGDYIPGHIQAGTSYKKFKENIKAYREIKERYPDAVKKAKESYVDWSKYTDGDPLDYRI